MKLGRRSSNYLFILLPLLLLTSISYASMGNITACFPFFLLLAFLVAAMLAQGKSPLVGFDISIRKPPSEIKSTAYKVKSYTSGGFDTVSKTRDMEGGGTHATRGTGWVANKFAKGLGKVAGKNWGKEGGFTHNLSQKGGMYALTKGEAGGGYAGNVERERKAKEKDEKEKNQEKKEVQDEKNKTKERTEKNVKSLRQMLVNPVIKAGWLGITGVASDKKKIKENKRRIKELEDKKKSGKELTKDEKKELSDKKKELSDLTVKVAANTINGMRTLSESLAEKEKQGILTPTEAKRLKSLRTELTALQMKYQELDNNQKKYGLLQKSYKEASDRASEKTKDVALLKVREKQFKDKINMLDSVGSAKARVKMMASPFTLVAAGAGLAARSTYRSLSKANKKERDKLKKELGANADKHMTKKERKRLNKIKEKQQHGGKLNADEDKLIKRARYQDLKDGKGTISSIFNPMGLSKGQYAKRLVKANVKGVSLAIWETPLPRLGRWVYGKSEARTEGGHLNSWDNANKILNKIDKLRGDIVNSQYISESEKYRKLGEIDRLFADLDRLVRREVPKAPVAKKGEEGKQAAKGLPIELKHEIAKGEREMGRLLGNMNESQKELNKLYDQRANAEKERREIKKNKGNTTDVNLRIKDLDDQIIARDKDLQSHTRNLRKLLKEKAPQLRAKIQDTAQNNKALNDLYNQRAKAEEERREIKKKKDNTEQIDIKLKDLNEKIKETRMSRTAALRHHVAMRQMHGWTGNFLDRTPEARAAAIRAAARSYAMMEDSYNAEVQKEGLKKKGLSSGSRLGWLLQKSLEPYQSTQNLKEFQVNVENVANTKLIGIQRLRHERTQIRSQLNESERKRDSLYDREKRLRAEIENLGSALKNIKKDPEATPNQIKQLDDELFKKRRELRELESFLEDNEKLIEDRKKNLERIKGNANALVNSVLLEDALLVQRQLDAKIKDNKLLGIESKGDKETLQKQLDAKIKDNKLKGRPINEGTADLRAQLETADLRAQLREASALTKRYAGKKEEAYSDLMRKLMTQTGDPAPGSETGLHRELYELNELLKACKDTKRLKDTGLKREEFDEKYIEARRNLVVAKLYMNERILSGSEQMISFEEAKKYDKKFDDATAKNSVANASSEAKMREMIIKLDKSELQKDRGLGWDQEVENLQKFIKGHEDKLKEAEKNINMPNVKKEELDLKKIEKEERDLKKTEKELRNTAITHRWALLLMREDAIDKLIVKSPEELAEHRNSFLKRMGRAPGAAWTALGEKLGAEKKEELKKLTQTEINERRRENLVNRLISKDVKIELNVLKEGYKSLEKDARALADKGRSITEGEPSAESKTILRKYSIEVKTSRENLAEIRKQMPEIKKEIKNLEGKKSKFTVGSDEYKEIESNINALSNKLPEAQRKFNESYNQWRGYKKESDAIFEPEQYRKLTKPGSERVEEEYFMDRRHDIENRIYGGRFSRFSEPASRLAANGGEFLFKHGGKVIGAAAVLSPLILAIPVVGPVAFLISEGAAATYGAKTIWRKKEEWVEHGYHDSEGFGVVARDALHSQRLASHFTGRGSGSPPKTWTDAWVSQMTGAEYMTRGFRVNRYGEVEPDKDKLLVPNEGLPWHIKIAKAPFDSIGATIAARVRKFTVWSQYHAESKDLALYILENPKVIPEVEDRVTYQYAKFYGSVEPLIHPKAALGMMRLNTPFPEYAKHIVLMRGKTDKTYSPGTALLGGEIEIVKKQFEKNMTRFKEMYENRRRDRTIGS